MTAWKVEGFLVTIGPDGTRHEKPTSEITPEDRQGMYESWTKNLRQNGYRLLLGNGERSFDYGT